MSIEYILFSFVVCIDIAIAVYLFFHKPHTMPKILFGLLSLMVASWAAVHIIAAIIRESLQLLLLAESSLLSVLFIPTLFLLFSLLMTRTDKLQPFIYYILFIPPILMLPFVFTRFSVTGFLHNEVAYENILVGSLYHFFIPYAIVFFSGAFVVLYRAIQKEQSPNKKIQLQYMLYSFLPVVVFGLLNNAILPTWFHVLTQPIYGIFGTIIFTIGISYAITRHRFFDIRFLITRGAAIAVFFLLMYGLLAALFMLSRLLFGENDFLVNVFIATFVICAVFLSSDHIRRPLNQIVGKCIPPEGFSLSKEINVSEKEEKTTKNFDMLAKDIDEEYKRIASVQNTTLFVYLRPEERWVPFGSDEIKPLFSDHLIPQALRLHKDIIIRQELSVDELWSNSGLKDIQQRQEVEKIMTKWHVDILVPLWWNGEEVHAFILVQLNSINSLLNLEEYRNIKKTINIFSTFLTSTINYHYSIISIYTKK
ncbi:MAG TPA: histidine kinase N-terminal 7TM domain-containing protein [Patescibacteria group bacterium]|nr:histidine kinase N-terminal 7TM domain-containing protein [Patescibacteria group bacterium]